MELVFDDTLFVHYGFVFLSPADGEDPDLDESRRGQANGLLGAATDGALSMMTGTHTGEVPVRIEWHETEPELGDAWDDVVEASVDVADPDLRLAAFDDARAVRLPAAGPHRVRMCASGFEAARREEDLGEDGPVPDRYLLQLWLAPAAPDVIVRVSGPGAQYWHDEANNLTAMSEQEWAARQAATYPPDAGGYEPWKPNVGHGLSDERLLADIPMSLRVELREPLARRVCESAHVAEREPIRSALEALGHWQPLPATMTSPDDVLAQLRTDGPRTGRAIAGWVTSGPDPVEQAVHAVFTAAEAATTMNLMPLLELAKAATGMNGEGLIREVCAERGYA